MPIFTLHPRLQQDCLIVAQLPLCRLLLMNDQQYPWFILVPARAEVREIYQLAEADRQQLLVESCLLAENMQQIYQPDKLNIATIGNLVPQLHMHHVARYQQDSSWPAPVWGKLPAQAYPAGAAELEIAKMREALGNCLVD